MARYLERVENLARLVDVTQTFESPGREAESWLALVRINADEEGFAKRGQCADSRGGQALLPARPRQPDLDSAPSLEAARTNARTLRPLISTEMWMQLNVFHRDMTADRRARAARRPAQPAVRAHQGRGADAYRHHRGHVLPRPGLAVLPARPADRARRPDHPAARHPLPPAGAGRRRRGAAGGRADAMGRGAARRRRLSRLPPGGAARLHAGRRGELPAHRPAFPAQRGALRRTDRVVPGPVAQPLGPARHAWRRWNGWRNCAAA